MSDPNDTVFKLRRTKRLKSCTINSTIIQFPVRQGGIPPQGSPELKQFGLELMQSIDARMTALPQSEGVIKFGNRLPRALDTWTDKTLSGSQDDVALSNIARHRKAVLVYDRAVDAESEAEGKVSSAKHVELQAATSQAYDDLMLMARGLVLSRPQTRGGTIQLAKYLASQFNDLVGCENGCMYMPEHMNGRPWPEVFLKTIARSLRNMGAEFPKMKRKRGRPSVGDDRRSLAFEKAIARIPPHLMPAAVRSLDALADKDF